MIGHRIPRMWSVNCGCMVVWLKYAWRRIPHLGKSGSGSLLLVQQKQGFVNASI